MFTCKPLILYRFLSLVIGVVWLSFPEYGSATAGMAEFMVDTPGGNQLGHCFRPQGGEISVCLFAGEAAPTHEIARGIKRWRYYEGFVVAEVAGGFLLVNENDKTVERIGNEKQLEARLTARTLAEALTGWLTDKDAMDEIWYPLTSWGFCRWKQGKLRGSARLENFYHGVQREVEKTSDSFCQRVDDLKLHELLSTR